MVLPERIYRAARDGDRDTVIAYLNAPAEVGGLYYDSGATLHDLREAVTTLEDLERITRRVFGGAHPLTASIWDELRDARAVLRARETPPGK